jgi:predicted transcriptional regulator with HTH domain
MLKGVPPGHSFMTDNVSRWITGDASIAFGALKANRVRFNGRMVTNGLIAYLIPDMKIRG